MSARRPAATPLRVLGLALWLSLGAVQSAGAATIVLYDGSLGGLPSDQGMVFSNFPPGTVTPAVGGGVTNLDTTGSNSPQAGFGALSPLALDDALGYSLEFTAEILSESHTGNAVRAGFSVILIGEDTTAGIEIGFQDGRVFAQNDAPLFGDPPADANPAFNPVGAGIIDFELAVLNNAYTLLADDVPVLSGSLRNYTGSGLLAYNIPNAVFLGDDTTSAQANVNLARVALVISAPVPEPTTIVLLLGLAAVGILARRGRRAI